ncbi:hypothetical protein THIOM_002323 [Candidatus Thiomargarita nelsonii]|uniref:Uncharacterized protein n=1 Tax=Candidatus Thiomargarita nelsonii TaxID=1003181 RepID=A0A176S1U5_9GAMM|nr:hypothetical protein THIOM_002323 [Candidatus Thiomargarita nelsonii]
MNLTVTKEGVLIPKQWLKGVDEVEVRRENHLILIIPFSTPKSVLQLDTGTIMNENHTDKEDTEADAEYKAAMQSYLSRPAYLLTDPSQKYPQRETLYDRDIMLR